MVIKKTIDLFRSSSGWLVCYSKELLFGSNFLFFNVSVSSSSDSSINFIFYSCQIYEKREREILIHGLGERSIDRREDRFTYSIV